MSVSTITETNWSSFSLSVASSPNAGQIGRIRAAFGQTGDGLPKVNRDTLARYYSYLSVNLSLEFTAYYPQPMNARERTDFRCRVLELLDPTQHLGDEFDGIFCRTRKGDFEVNLPLIELQIPDDSSDFQLIEDYSFWFWNWR
jgi:hypothetical protein